MDGHEHSTARTSFLGEAPPSEAADTVFANDVKELGHVMNLSLVWAHQPEAKLKLFEIFGSMAQAAGLTFRERGVLVSAAASTLGDSYCSLAWGSRLASEAGGAAAAGVLHGDDAGLEARDQALARWARKVAAAPTSTTEADIDQLRAAGFDDGQIAAITIFVAARLAFSTVNNALGTRPDAAFRDTAPAEVRDAVSYGRPIADA